MTAVTEWEGEIEISLAVARVYPAGEWDVSEWDAAEWDDADTPLGDWLDVTCDTLVPIRLKAGASRTDGIVTRWEAATATLSLLGRQYDPRTGPWAGKLGTGLPVRIRWRPLDAGPDEWRTVFLGDVQNGGFGWDPAEGTASLNCQDRTANLVAFDMLPTEPPIGADEWASARIHRLCGLAYVPDEERDITSGGVTLLPSKLGGTAWSNMLAVADTDIALLWVRRDGRLAFRPEGRVAENVPVAAVLVACPDEIVPGVLAKNLLLDDDQASAETALVWQAWAGGMTLARSADRAAAGAWSVKMTPAPNGFAQASPNLSWDQRTRVTPGLHTVMLSLWEATAHTPHDLYVQYFDEAGANVGTASTTRFEERNPGGWIAHRALVQVPPGATRLLVMVSTGGFSNGRLTRQITNDFETSMGNYVGASANLTQALDSTVFHGGTQSLRMDRLTSAGTIQFFSNSQAVTPKDPIVPGQQVTLSVWVRHNRALGPTTWVLVARFNLGNAGLVDVAGPGVSVPANTWTLLTFTTTAPANVDSVTLRVNTAANMGVGESAWIDDAVGVNDSIVASEVVYYDRAGVFEGDVPVEGWTLPSWQPPDDETAIGYVDLLDADPIILRNWVTLARRKLEGTGATDPAIVTRVDDASVARFRPQTYRNVALENADDAWTSTVAEVVLADGAWPSTGPETVELDTRVHSQPSAVAAVLLDLEPEHVFSVESPIDRVTRWRMLAQGWDVEIRPEYVAGSVALDDVTGWGTAAGWDDPAPPHGWDIDTWALSGWTGGASGPGGLPIVRVYSFSPVPPFDTSPPGSTVQIPLVDPGTGQAAYSFPVEAGTFSFVANVKVSATSPPKSQAIRVSISVNGSEIGSQTTTTAVEATIGVSVASYVLGSATNLVELNIRTPDIPVQILTPTTLTLTRSV